MTVAALYVDPAGVYAGLPGVEVWDEARDARTYAGPWPVVAHPPCARWCGLAALNASRGSLPIGADGGCFAAALEAVERFGGVLEHPAFSRAWPRFGLPRPGRHGWTGNLERPGYAAEVSQVSYGHAARKQTWLYAVGCQLPDLNWRDERGTAAIGGGVNVGNCLDLRKLNGREASSTPPAFRDVLLSMARSAALAKEKGERYAPPVLNRPESYQ